MLLTPLHWLTTCPFFLVGRKPTSQQCQYQDIFSLLDYDHLHHSTACPNDMSILVYLSSLDLLYPIWSLCPLIFRMFSAECRLLQWDVIKTCPLKPTGTAEHCMGLIRDALNPYLTLLNFADNCEYTPVTWRTRLFQVLSSICPLKKWLFCFLVVLN